MNDMRPVPENLGGETLLCEKTSCWLTMLTYALILGLGVYYIWGRDLLYPGYFLILGMAVVGLGSSGIYLNLAKRQSPESPVASPAMKFFIFQLFQVVVVFSFQHFLFNFKVLQCLPFLIGALLSGVAWLLCYSSLPLAWGRVLLSGILLGGMVLALRFQGVMGSLVYGIAVFNGAWLGRALLPEARSKDFWTRALFFLGTLIVGRALLQYYLSESNYLNLGVVISQPYSFVCLFGGLLAVCSFYEFSRERIFPPWVLFLLFGVLLPMALGFVLYLRPSAAYLMGVLISVYALGIFFSSSLALGLLSDLSFLTLCAALPLFKRFANLSRVVRLEILLGLLVLVGLALFFKRRGPNGDARAE